MLLIWSDLDWRRGGESNPRIKVLQTSALPLGYRAGNLLTRVYSTNNPRGPILSNRGLNLCEESDFAPRVNGHSELGREVERAACSDVAVQPDSSAQHAYQSRRDGQPETRT